MCGVAGLVFTEHAKKDWTILERMAKHQHMRGPDGMKVWTHNNTGLAHNRLAILDLSTAGDMPMGSLHWEVVFNGEIYNYKTLRQHLTPNDDLASTKLAGNDSRLLVDYLEKFGFDKTLNDIEGMFSFLAWNYGERKLYCAVDPTSIKQLFWYKSGKFFAVASSPGALTHCEEKWEFNKDALTDYLALGATKDPLFSGMRKVLPGGYVVYDQAEESVRWGCWYPSRSENHNGTGEREILKETLESIQSVKEADVPVCMFLSGGIDSSVVASQCPGMPAMHLASPEEEFAQQVGKKYGNMVEVIHPANYEARECLEDYSRQSGDASMAAIIPYIVSKEVAKTHKVAISSNGADELFYGYNRTQGGDPTNQVNHIFRRLFFDQSSWSCTHKAREFELASYVSYDLNKTLDFASMCHGLEVRVPYLNRKVIEKALSLPRERHVFGYRTKRILKEFLLKEGFSDQFVDRPKQGFSLFYEPEGHENLKNEGVKFLKERFGIDPGFKPGTRDERYYAASAASFLCWWNVWRSILV